MPGKVLVLSVTADQEKSQRDLVKVRALAYCQGESAKGRRLELSVGQEIIASIAKDSFSNMGVDEVLDGAHFCRFAIDHEQATA